MYNKIFAQRGKRDFYVKGLYVEEMKRRKKNLHLQHLLINDNFSSRKAINPER